MPEIRGTVELPWASGAALRSAPVVLPWASGAPVRGFGGAYVPRDPPAGGSPIAPAPLAPGAVLPSAAMYSVAHTLLVVDERDDSAVNVTGISFSTDVDSLVWTATLRGNTALRAQMLAGEQPPVLRVTLDGAVWRFVVDSVSSDMRHGSLDCSVTARSPAIVAGAPYEGEQNWSSDEDTTAAQVVAIANQYTGLEVQWGLDDWIIPARILTFSGTPLALVKRIAETVGAVVQSDPAEPLVRVFPRYPSFSNEWPTTVPNVEIAADAVLVEAQERADRPPYDGVYLSGQQSGALGFVRREGTAGAFLHPLVTDLLLTDQPAVRQRGVAILGASGEQMRVTLQLPVLYGSGRPGVLLVGQLVRVLDPEATWYGLVRSVSVSVALPSVLQSVVIERHTAAIPGTELSSADVSDPLIFDGPIPALGPVVGVPFSLALAGYWSGGEEPYAWSLRSGALPAGLTLDASTGVVSGTPTSAGSASAVFRAVDAVDGQADSPAFDFTVAPAIAFSGSISAQSSAVGASFSLALSAFWTGGTAPNAYSVFSGVLPAGLTLNPSTGAVTGTPTTVGSGSVMFRATDALGSFANSNLVSFTVTSIVTFAGPIPAQAPVRTVPFTVALAGYWTGGAAPITYSVVSGPLPTGLTLNSSTGVLSGTPTSPTTRNVVFRATDAGANVANSNTVTFTIGVPVAFVGTVAAQSPNVGYRYSLLLAGFRSVGVAPFTWSVFSGTLPAGLSLNASTGEVSGTPTTAGSATIVFRVTDAQGSSANSNSVSYVVGANVPAALILPFTGADGSTTITDVLPSPATMTARNGAAISTAIADCFGGSSGSLRLQAGGLNDMVTASRTCAIGAGTFTLEVFCYSAATVDRFEPIFAATRSSATRPLVISHAAISGLVQVDVGTTSFASGNVAPRFGWHHIAVTRDASGVVRLFVGGALQNFTTSTSTITSGGPYTFGAVLDSTSFDSSSFVYVGYMNWARVIEGACLYTANFTPPSGPY